MQGFYENIGVGVISAAAFAVIAILIIVGSGSGVKTKSHKSQKGLPLIQSHTRSYANPEKPILTSSFKSGYSIATKIQPTTLYHGTTLTNALEIYRTHLWLVGKSKPPAVWMGNRIEIAKKYSGTGKKAAIVVVQVDSDLNLSNRGNGVFILEIPGAKPNEEYHQVDGLKPIDVINPSGKSILHNII